MKQEDSLPEALYLSGLTRIVSPRDRATAAKELRETDNDHVVFLNQRSWWQWVTLIRKLRWIGLEDEARRLELAVSKLPPEERDCMFG
jgi:hypothetical protein